MASMARYSSVVYPQYIVCGTDSSTGALVGLGADLHHVGMFTGLVHGPLRELVLVLLNEF